MEPISSPRTSPRMSLTTPFAIPGYLLATYALLLLSLGWFAHQRWMERPVSVTVSTTAPQQPIESMHKEDVPQPDQAAPALPPESASAPAPSLSPATAVIPKPVKVENGHVPPLVYSAHVFTSDPARRSITLNGVRYLEGESPLDGLVIEQIQQDVTLFDADGDIFILDALADWPGGDIKEVGAE